MYMYTFINLQGSGAVMKVQFSLDGCSKCAMRKYETNIFVYTNQNVWIRSRNVFLFWVSQNSNIRAAPLCMAATFTIERVAYSSRSQFFNYKSSNIILLLHNSRLALQNMNIKQFEVHNTSILFSFHML